MLASTVRDTTREERQRIWDGARAVVHQRFADPLTVDDVSAEVFASRRQVQRVFLEVGDTTFREYLCVIRMRAAALLLVRTPLPVGGVARRVGYSSRAQFARSFRRVHGVTPLQYRARHAGRR